MKKFLSLLLVFVLLFSATPLAVSAAELPDEMSVVEQLVEESEASVDSTSQTVTASEPVEETLEPTEPSEATSETSEPVEETSEPAVTEATEATESEEILTVIGVEGEEAYLASEAFSCYTFDTRGDQLNGYCSGENDWYLFLTSTQSVSNTVLYYTGSIESVSAGELNTDTATVTGAFAHSGDQVTLHASDGTTYSVTAMQSQLPSVYISLNDTTLDQVHTDKNIKYGGNSIEIMDPNGPYNLSVKNSVEFKGRGNSTWNYFEKKGYQIKFDSKTSVLGMGKAKKWVLLANASDETLMHNTLAFDLASQMDMDFVSSFAYIDLWIDGDYRGNFIIGEKVEIGSNRLDLQDPYGTLFEQDMGFYFEEDYYFYNDQIEKYFSVKETNVDDSNPAEVQVVIDSFQDSLNELMTYLDSTDPRDITLSKLGTMIDVDSIAKYYLINEYCLNSESTAGSFYWYKDGLDDVLHVGPVWDFDSSMGNEKSTAKYCMLGHELFNTLLASPAFYNRTVELYEQYKSAFNGMSSTASSLRNKISSSVSMNFIRWNVWGTENPKSSLKAYSNSYVAGYSKLVNWLNSRADSFIVQRPIPVYRLYNAYTGEHLLTANADERDQLVSTGWSLDGTAWNAPVSGIPVYRLYNPYGDFHFYTISQKEIDTLTPLGWRVDGTVFYSAAEEDGRPVYRLYNPYAKTNYHLFTADVNERDFLASLGWRPEGVAWYATK